MLKKYWLEIPIIRPLVCALDVLSLSVPVVAYPVMVTANKERIRHVMAKKRFIFCFIFYGSVVRVALIDRKLEETRIGADRFKIPIPDCFTQSGPMGNLTIEMAKELLAQASLICPVSAAVTGILDQRPCRKCLFLIIVFFITDVGTSLREIRSS